MESPRGFHFQPRLLASYPYFLLEVPPVAKMNARGGACSNVVVFHTSRDVWLVREHARADQIIKCTRTEQILSFYMVSKPTAIANCDSWQQEVMNPSVVDGKLRLAKADDER